MRGSQSRVLAAFVSHPFYIPQRIILYLFIVIRGFYPALLCPAVVSTICIYWRYCVFSNNGRASGSGGWKVMEEIKNNNPAGWCCVSGGRLFLAVTSSFLTSLTPCSLHLAGVVTVIGRTIKCERGAECFLCRVSDPRRRELCSSQRFDAGRSVIVFTPRFVYTTL